MIDFRRFERRLDRPALLCEAIQLAERLAGEFVFVRVDLYFVRGRIYVGELTHYPAGGHFVFTPESFDRALGDVVRFNAPIPEEFFDNPPRGLFELQPHAAQA